MPKNTFILVSFLAIFAALIIGVNFGRRFSSQPAIPNQPSLTHTPSPQPSEHDMQTYSNSYCGISFDYPTSFTKLEAASGSAIFLNPDNANASIAVACQEEIPRPPLSAENIEVATLSGVTVMLYHDTSAKDGTPLDKLIFRHPGSKLTVFLAGTGEVFQNLLKTLTIF